MLDKITKYINFEENNDAGQKSDGTWYCKTLKFKDADDLLVKGKAVNDALNKLNSGSKKEIKLKIEKSEKK